MPTGIYIRTVEQKQKIAESLRGRKRNPFSEEWKKKISIALHNRVYSVKTRMKMSESHSGDKTNLWKGGVDRKIYKHYNNAAYRIWRRSVFERDDYTCQNKDCNKKGVFLHPHHIKSYTYYPELRYDVNNGTTLCKNCHENLHGIKKLEV